MVYVLVVLAVALSTLSFEIVGVLSGTDILIILLTPFLLMGRPDALRVRGVKLIFAMLVVWLLSQMVSDMLNNSLPRDYLRGWANIGMVGFRFAFFVVLIYMRPNAYLVYLGAVALIKIAQDAVSGQLIAFAMPEYWDLVIAGWAMPVLVLFMFLTYSRRPLLSILAPIVYGMAAIVFDARSHGLIAVMAGLILLVVRYSPYIQQQFTFRQWMKLGGVMAVGLGALFLAYVTLGQQGLLGAKAKRELRLAPNPYNPIDVISVARNEVFIAKEAIKDKPLFGHGSWPKNPKYEVLWQQKFGQFVGRRVQDRSERYGEGTIPAHSVIFQAWIWSGTFGVLIWFVVIGQFFVLFRFFSLRRWNPYTPIIMLIMAYTAWHLFFSPYGYARGFWPPAMAFCLVLRHYIQMGEAQAAHVMLTQQSAAAAGGDDEADDAEGTWTSPHLPAPT